MSSFELDTYLSRLQLDRLPEGDEARLFALHRSQLTAIPFENLSPFLGLPVSLDESALVTKLVGSRRGGYCFELNSLFELALRALRIPSELRLARVLYNRPSIGPRTHCFLRVQAGGRTWLADVGFGGPCPLYPIPLENDRENRQSHGETFRLRSDSTWGRVLEKYIEPSWVPLYAFAEEQTIPMDVQVANHFTAMHPESPFRQRLMCAIFGKAGRMTLLNQKLSLGSEIEDASSLRTALSSLFGIHLGEAEQTAWKIRFASGLPWTEQKS